MKPFLNFCLVCSLIMTEFYWRVQKWTPVFLVMILCLHNSCLICSFNSFPDIRCGLIVLLARKMCNPITDKLCTVHSTVIHLWPIYHVVWRTLIVLNMASPSNCWLVIIQGACKWNDDDISICELLLNIKKLRCVQFMT